jgi:hypothetical protein
MRRSTIGFIVGGMAAFVGTVLMLKPEALAANWPNSAECPWGGHGAISLGLLALGLFVAVLALLCWLWEDRL